MEILFVEDETGIREALSAYLRMQGFHVRPAGTLSRGWRILEESPPDLLVTDVDLPDGSGLVLADLAGKKGIPALLATANPSKEVSGWIAGRPGACLLGKPIDPSELLQRVREVQAPEAPAPEGGDPWHLLESERITGEARDRCMLALLPFLGKGRLVEAKREGARIRLVVDSPGQGVPERLSSMSRRCLQELGADFWQVDGATLGDRRIQVLVWLPGHRREDGKVLDLEGSGRWPMERIVERLETARDSRRGVWDLAPWHRLGLALLGRGELLPDPVRRPRPETAEKVLLWPGAQELAGGGNG